jgi:hypothetical protein
MCANKRYSQSSAIRGRVRLIAPELKGRDGRKIRCSVRGMKGKYRAIRIFLIGVLCGVMITAAVAFGLTIPATAITGEWRSGNAAAERGASTEMVTSAGCGPLNRSPILRARNYVLYIVSNKYSERAALDQPSKHAKTIDAKSHKTGLSCSRHFSARRASAASGSGYSNRLPLSVGRSAFDVLFRPKRKRPAGIFQQGALN